MLVFWGVYTSDYKDEYGLQLPSSFVSSRCAALISSFGDVFCRPASLRDLNDKNDKLAATAAAAAATTTTTTTTTTNSSTPVINAGDMSYCFAFGPGGGKNLSSRGLSDL